MPTLKFGMPGAPARGPGGRPKAVKVVEDLARENTVLAMQTLVEICGDQGQPANARVTAANSILDRGWGKPTQDHKINVSVDPANMTDDQLAAIAAGGIVRHVTEEDATDTRH